MNALKTIPASLGVLAFLLCACDDGSNADHGEAEEASTGSNEVPEQEGSSSDGVCEEASTAVLCAELSIELTSTDDAYEACFWNGQSCEAGPAPLCEDARDQEECAYARQEEVPFNGCSWAEGRCEPTIPEPGPVGNECEDAQEEFECTEIASVYGLPCSWDGTMCIEESEEDSEPGPVGNECEDAQEELECTEIASVYGLPCSWDGAMCIEDAEED